MTTNDFHDPALFPAIGNDDVKALEEMLERGLDVNQIYDEESLLTYAARRPAEKCIHLLISRRADLNFLNSDDLTALSLVCLEGKAKGSRIARDLISAGCDVTVRRDDGMSALEFAVKRCEPDIIGLLVSHGLPVDGPPDCDLTPAMLAARADNEITLKALCDLGADLSLKCGLPWAKGLTCLELAELEKCKKAIKFLRALK